MTTPDHAHMQRAIELARNGWYSTPPNPRVGCVLIRDGRIIGEGWHEQAGEAHAEVRALADARQRGHDIRGATACVTLEPCSHYGKTPPCADTLIEAGIARVVLGAHDPNPKIDGRGIQRLRDAGVELVTGIDTDACEALNPGFNHRMLTGRPRVRVKLAMTLDGRTAAADGTSQWITGAAARDDVHRLRAESGAVLVGSGTARADDPSLNVRLPGEGWRQPMRVVLDSRLRLSPQARMLDLPGTTRIYTTSNDTTAHKALADAGADIRISAADTHGLALTPILEDLANDGINDLLIEAGPTLAGTLAAQNLADEFIIYMAPQFMGHTGRGLLNLPGATTLNDRINLHIRSIDPMGDDWRIRATTKAD